MVDNGRLRLVGATFTTPSVATAARHIILLFFDDGDDDGVCNTACVLQRERGWTLDVLVPTRRLRCRIGAKHIKK